MKKLALMTLVAVLGMTFAAGSASAWSIVIRNSAGGNDSFQNAKLEVKNKFEAQVYNNTNANITEVSINDVSSALNAGDDAEGNSLTSGTIEQTLGSDVSANDVVILTPDCGCAGSSENSSSNPTILLENADDDTMQNADATMKHEVAAQTANNLGYNESTVNVNTARTDLNADDDAENNTLKPGGSTTQPTVKTTITRNRVLNRALVSPASSVTITQ